MAADSSSDHCQGSVPVTRHRHARGRKKVHARQGESTERDHAQGIEAHKCNTDFALVVLGDGPPVAGIEHPDTSVHHWWVSPFAEAA